MPAKWSESTAFFVSFRTSTMWPSYSTINASKQQLPQRSSLFPFSYSCWESKASTRVKLTKHLKTPGLDGCDTLYVGGGIVELFECSRRDRNDYSSPRERISSSWLCSSMLPSFQFIPSAALLVASLVYGRAGLILFCAKHLCKHPYFRRASAASLAMNSWWWLETHRRTLIRSTSCDDFNHTE
jgi:hypothetical protein